MHVGGRSIKPAFVGPVKLSLVILQILVMVQILVLGKQTCYMTDALGDSLPEEQLGAQSQILRVLDEAKANNGPLSSSKLVLKPEVKKDLQSVSKCNTNKKTHQPFREGTPP